MSLPSELRALCHILSTTQTSNLPHIIPTLQRLALGCGPILSIQDGSSVKTDTSESSVLVHKLKTQISGLLNGRVPEGRFAAVVLIQAVIDVGGWEVLRGSESWVRGLLSILNKPDPVASKKLVILTLTSIYTYTHQYQTLVREITTPTLPTFVTSCLNLIAPKSSSSIKIAETQGSVVEAILECFAALVPRHPAIFRPFNSQIRAAILPYLAPTISDTAFIPVSIATCARRLSVVLYQTAPKNTSGEEWAKGMRNLIKDIHGTADLAFRAAIEDWESNSGYIAGQVDVDADLEGGALSATDLPKWEGVTAGVERLTGQIYLLEQFFVSSTTTAVTVPMGAILDLITRMLSIAGPSTASADGYAGARTNPAIDREEREGVWASLPQVHIASMKVLATIVDRLQSAFSSMSQHTLDQLTWLFPSGSTHEEFRAAVYQLVARLLPLGGGMMLKPSVIKLTPIIRACCKDLRPYDASAAESQPKASSAPGQKNKSNGSLNNADSFLQNPSFFPENRIQSAYLTEAAQKLLPLFLSHLPQQHLELSTRADIDRTAIITQNKDAMLTSVLNPFTGKGGKRLTSILPHLCRNFSSDPAIECLLRPRMPPLPAVQVQEEAIMDEMEDSPMVDSVPYASSLPVQQSSISAVPEETSANNNNKRPQEDEVKPVLSPWGNTTETTAPVAFPPPSKRARTEERSEAPQIVSEDTQHALNTTSSNINIVTGLSAPNGEDVQEDSDSDESIAPLNMELDSDSEDEEET